MIATTRQYEPKTVHLLHKCKACKRCVRTTVTVEDKSVCNNHPEYYLRSTRHSRRINGGAWVELRYAWFPSIDCPGCGAKLQGKAVEGRYNPQHPCDRRCTGATGHNCECACGGQNHGLDHQS